MTTWEGLSAIIQDVLSGSLKRADTEIGFEMRIYQVTVYSLGPKQVRVDWKEKA